jgi:hypothetical protein
MGEEEFEMNIFDDLNFDDLNFENEDLEQEDQEQENTDDQSDNNDKDLDESESSEEVGEDEVGDEGEGEKDNSPNLYSSLFSVLHEEGLLPSLNPTEVKVENVVDLVDVFKKEIESQSELKMQQYLQNIDISKIAESKKNLEDLSSIDEDYLKDNLEVAKQIIKQDYLNQGLSEERVNKLLNKTIDLGEDVIIGDALESLESLKVFDQRRIEEEQKLYKQRLVEQEKAEKELQEKIKNQLYSAKELIEGLPVNKAIQDKIYNSMNTVVSKNPETGELENELMKARRENPLEFDLRLYQLFTITNGFKSLKNIANNTKSKLVKELEESIRKTPIKDNGIPSFLQDTNSYLGIGDEINT